MEDEKGFGKTHKNPSFTLTFWQWSPQWYNYSVYGDVAELADAHDLESCAARCVGSSPSIPIILTFNNYQLQQPGTVKQYGQQTLLKFCW